MLILMCTKMAEPNTYTSEVLKTNEIMYTVNRIWGNIKKFHIPFLKDMKRGRGFDKNNLGETKN